MNLFKINDIVEFPMLAGDDYLKRSKLRLIKWSPLVYADMNMNIIRKAVREEFVINRRTNTVDLPCSTSDLCSVSVVDRHGCIHPLYVNDRLHDDLVVIPAEKDCNCEFNCGFKLCNTIKGYEAVTSTKSDTLPDGTPVSFTCVDRFAVDKNGFLYSENQYPLRVYQSGVWTNTILHTEITTACKLECDDHGCVCDTQQNMDLVCNACGFGTTEIPCGGNASTPPNNHTNKWIYYCNSQLNFLAIQCGQHPILREEFCNTYSISELGNRLIFPHHFPFNKVLIRYYPATGIKDIEIPLIAVPAFVTGLKWFDARWDDKKQNLEQKYSNDYVQAKWGLFSELNKYTLAEYAMMLAPHRHIPSYIRHGGGGFWGNQFLNV
jgi:hypothetical protein